MSKIFTFDLGPLQPLVSGPHRGDWFTDSPSEKQS